MKNFYLIIICNRINFLKNVHAFYSCTDIQVKIVHNLLVNLDQYKAPNIDFFFNQNTNPFERALELLKNSNVSYCQLFSDDDFVFEDVICKSVDFLENNSDFVSCQGLLLNFDYRDTEIHSPEKIDSSIINKEDDSKNKNFRFFQSLTSRFVDRIYSITKKEVLIDIIDTAKPLFKNYAPKAKKIIVNIDKNQLKNLNVKFDLKIKEDIAAFLDMFERKNYRFKNQWEDYNYFKKQNWYEPKKTKSINSNVAIKNLTKNIKQKKCIIVDGGGTALYAGFQSSVIGKDDRLICSSSISAMGTGLAESLGASKSKNFKKYICIIGDGSFLMNIQDLQSIIQDKINILIIIVNNNGYLAIRDTQKEFLKSRFYGTHPDWKLQMPSFKNLSKGFKIKHFRIKNDKDFNKYKKNFLHDKGPLICELVVDQNQASLFKQGYKSNPNGTFTPQPLSEMHPFLSIPIANTNN